MQVYAESYLLFVAMIVVIMVIIWKSLYSLLLNLYSSLRSTYCLSMQIYRLEWAKDVSLIE